MMTCPHCHLWTLLPDDNACSWCGACFLAYDLHLTPIDLPTTDYPPPILLTITNQSPTQTITVTRLQSTQLWLTPLSPLPTAIPAHTQQTLLLDADVYAAPPHSTAYLQVEVAHAPTQSATLRLH